MAGMTETGTDHGVRPFLPESEGFTPTLQKGTVRRPSKAVVSRAKRQSVSCRVLKIHIACDLAEEMNATSESHAMTFGHSVELAGCRPTPLAAYLKAIGILRIVALQADSAARGYWREDRFWLESQLDQTQLTTFFLERYEPSPIVGPWGARSGFYPGSSEEKTRVALDRITSSDEPRLARYGFVIDSVRRLLTRMGFRSKDDVPDRKRELLMECRSSLPDDVLPWLDATYVLLEEECKYPPLLGTGGNEGNASYLLGFAQQVVAALLDREWDAALSAALFDEQDCDLYAKQTPGHFSPEATGGPNAASAFDADARMNPWDYLFTVEGTLVFAAAAARKFESSAGTLSYPFCVRQTGSGYASASPSDEKESRAEMWLPLWSRPCNLNELASLFGEGRANLGRRRARTEMDFARAVATLGTDRGISAFERYGFQVRNGLSTFALPLGRFHVHHQPDAELLDELDHWLERFRGKAAGDAAPASIGRALRQLENTIFTFLDQDVHDELVEQLLWGLVLIDWPRARPQLPHPGSQHPLPLGDYALLKLCHVAASVRGVSIHLEPGITAALASGDLSRAVEQAVRRLRASGAPMAFDSLTVTQSRQRCDRILAALLLPIAHTRADRQMAPWNGSDLDRLCDLVLEQSDESLEERLPPTED